MPAEHDLDPDAMTEKERLAKRRYEAYFAFETQPLSEQWDDKSGSATHRSGRSCQPMRKEQRMKRNKQMARVGRDGELIVETLVQWADRINRVNALPRPKVNR